MKKITSLCIGSLLIASSAAYAETGYGKNPKLPTPNEDASVTRGSKDIGWPDDKTPLAPKNFKVARFASDLKNPRWIYILPNGDVLVAEASTSPFSNANRISLLRDADGDGMAETRSTFLDGLNKPFGMVLVGQDLYVANTDGVLRYPYQNGQTEIKDDGEKILDLPAGGYNNHWTRNIVASPDQRKLLISVGSGSNVGEHGLDNEVRRANILEVDLEGRHEAILASGLRNPVGMDFEPSSGQLWAAVNERDKLGDDLVPDYITSVKRGGFYGWPFSYFGQNEDPRMAGQDADAVKRAIVPDYALGAHTASLGLTFSRGNFSAPYNNGVFVGQHGSWNRSEFSGYKVIFVPFKNGQPSGKPVDFLTGFMADEKTGETYGRPVGVTFDQTGALLVADDSGNTIWRVSSIKR